MVDELWRGPLERFLSPDSTFTPVASLATQPVRAPAIPGGKRSYSLLRDTYKVHEEKTVLLRTSLLQEWHLMRQVLDARQDYKGLKDSILVRNAFSFNITS